MFWTISGLVVVWLPGVGPPGCGVGVCVVGAAVRVWCSTSWVCGVEVVVFWVFCACGSIGGLAAVVLLTGSGRSVCGGTCCLVAVTVGTPALAVWGADVRGFGALLRRASFPCVVLFSLPVGSGSDGYDWGLGGIGCRCSAVVVLG
jgi:hypothetical protein